MSVAVDVKTLTIDGKNVSARAGQTILEVARENKINIPTLCHLDGLSDVGACRLCVVEIKGQNKLLPACVTSVFEGMEVTTKSERLQKHRRTILEVLRASRRPGPKLSVVRCERVSMLCVRVGTAGLAACGTRQRGIEVVFRLLHQHEARQRR